MQDFLGIKIDTTKMSTEKLTELRKEALEMASYLSHQLSMRKIAEHRHPK